MSIREEFKSITGFSIFDRQTNYISDGIERKDPLFNQLTLLYLNSPQAFIKLKKRIRHWLEKEKSETTFSLAGYICYVSEDFKKAKQYFFKTVSLNPDNLDNWIDLAFSLRHSGEYEISNDILFNYDYVMYYYKYLNLTGCSYPKLKKMVLEINRRANAV